MRDFYPWYIEDVMVEVTEEVAEELLADQRYIKASRRRVYRNKAHFSLDAEDGIEYSACFANPSPQELMLNQRRPDILIDEIIGIAGYLLIELEGNIILKEMQIIRKSTNWPYMSVR